MIGKVRKLYRAVAEMSLVPGVIDRIESQLRGALLSPIDRYLFSSGVYNNSGLYHFSYEDWRIKRINKILEIYGINFFKDKRVLEVGCGHGDIGAFFAELGAQVLCLDGRIHNVNFASLKHRNVKNITFQHFNLENEFSQFGKFDLLINFGLLYHLKKVDEHLKCCFQVSDDIIFETVVCDSTDPHTIFFCDEDESIDEEAVEGVGSRPSPFYVERVALENGFDVIPYFTADLNSGDTFLYDWPHRNDNRMGEGFRLRRFWRFKKAS